MGSEVLSLVSTRACPCEPISPQSHVSVTYYEELSSDVVTRLTPVDLERARTLRFSKLTQTISRTRRILKRSGAVPCLWAITVGNFEFVYMNE